MTTEYLKRLFSHQLFQVAYLNSQGRHTEMGRLDRIHIVTTLSATVNASVNNVVKPFSERYIYLDLLVFKYLFKVLI